MLSSESRISRRLFAAFAIIAMAFVASGVYADWLSVEIDSESQILVTNALPSISHLSVALDALSDLEAAVEDYAEAPAAERAGARSHVDELRRRVDDELSRYRALPRYPGEDTLYQNEPDALRRVDAAIDRVAAEVEAGDAQSARATAERAVRPRVNRAAGLLRQLLQLNSAEASDGAARIQATRRQVADAALVLNVITLVLTAMMAVWLWRVFRSFSRLQVEHAKLVERRAQELELFGSRVAHDMLSPLSSLTFCLASFKTAAEGDPKLQDAMRRARECVVRARGLVNALLEFARSGGEPASGGHVEVAPIVHQIAEEARTVDPAERAEIEVALPLPVCAVRCTSGVLASILGNLVRNAIQCTRGSASRRVVVRAARQGDRVRFEVQDTGPGIPEGFEQAIFEPYTRGPGTSQGGLGLGLATVKRLCEAHGGEVGVRPAPGGGSIFAFTIPIHVEDRSQADVRDVGRPPHAAAS